MNDPDTVPPRPRLGVSRCLLGERVRYDGGHRRDDWLTQVLLPHVELVALCPEAEAGLGTPREPMQLERGPGDTQRLRGRESGQDHAPALRAWVDGRLPELEGPAGPDGYVLKARSPSCGRAVPVNGQREPRPGLFAAALETAAPSRLLVDETALHDATAREAFVIRLFALARLRERLAGEWTAGNLSAFHAREKMLLLAHGRPDYDRLGRLVAAAGTRPRAELAAEYAAMFARALARGTTRGAHVNVLQHLLGHFREYLPADERAALQAAIEDFGAGRRDRMSVVRRLRERADALQLDWVRRQSYLRPAPDELLTGEAPANE
ncbi:DUF523 and DUF1722 domain-containing protein [Thioalkalivibrio sp. ALE20]|uniref:YbgA family protein n=1 Tax=Thioalkalivibrio sp. ALE20 TaxID=545275 RepID=UPI000476215B|nr:DUF523 and DUF1722 domain-containing protein [Thioalkalivibrio sp. ALE20]